ncbi:hypothetical protein [Paraflavitalea sp. CAU 1676]|uniref:hypothetical protein n=1 Tax=Paraflavitalea sp. CAU 1676 TaxID=3032598 RepID=UPI0023DC3E45|nr:hypothetical protein [Paraflavitalea sp. CAU 1676]MDF2188523.1 hypothetical protein [Paraflavitalea sp. CAU 1676]
MGQLVQALIEHRLTPEGVLEIPRILNTSLNENVAGEWIWTVPTINKQVLIELWLRKAEYFLKNAWSVEDLALLEKGELTLHFFAPSLIAFDASLKWFSYTSNGDQRYSFNNLAKEISNLCKAVDVIIASEVSDAWIDEHEILTVDMVRQKAIGNKNLAIELE